MQKLYPESGVELNPFVAKFYDSIMNIGSLGQYKRFIKNAIRDMQINPTDTILDLGCGTGRNAMLMSEYLDSQGTVSGLDISADMQLQFFKNAAMNNKMVFIDQRIDIPFDLKKQYDKIFISFVIHGFPHEVREEILRNVYKHLKPGGAFFILDFAEFDMQKMPFHHRFVFKKIECPYAFDYIKRDWKSILKKHGFDCDAEYFYFKNYVRLLKGNKQ